MTVTADLHETRASSHNCVQITPTANFMKIWQDSIRWNYVIHGEKDVGRTDGRVLHINSHFYFRKGAEHHNVLFKTLFELQCGRGPGGQGARRFNCLQAACLTVPSPVTHCYQYNKQKIIEPPVFLLHELTAWYSASSTMNFGVFWKKKTGYSSDYR